MPIICSFAIVDRSPSAHAERRYVPPAGTERSRYAPATAIRRTHKALLPALRRLALSCVFLAASCGSAAAATSEAIGSQALEIESSLYGFPKRAQEELAGLLTRADTASPAVRRQIYALYGQAAVAAGNSPDAL